jgi:isopentenyldiphosphate isomerase
MINIEGEKMKEEYLDIYDNDRILAGTAPRTEVHSKGYWHKTFHCWVLSIQNNNLCILFQKRQEGKETYPNLYDISSAGHLSAGEEIEQGVRELNEELGIEVEFEELYDIGMSTEVLVGNNFIDKEIHHVFLYYTDKALGDYIVQVEEVSGLVYLELEQICKLFNNEIDEIKAESMEVDHNGAKHYRSINLCKNCFVPHDGEYYMKVFNKAVEYLKKIIR